MQTVDAAVSHYIEHQTGWSTERFVSITRRNHDVEAALHFAAGRRELSL